MEASLNKLRIEWIRTEYIKEKNNFIKKTSCVQVNCINNSLFPLQHFSTFVVFVICRKACVLHYVLYVIAHLQWYIWSTLLLYTYTDVKVCIFTYTIYELDLCVFIRLYVCVCVCVCVCPHIYGYVCPHIYGYVCPHIYGCVCPHIYGCVCPHIYKQTNKSYTNGADNWRRRAEMDCGSVA